MQDDMIPNIDFLVDKSKEWGAVEAKIINPQSVVTAAWVRLKCQFGCGRYNKSHCCPPNTPAPEQMRNVLDCYHQAILIHFKGKVSPAKVVVKLEKEAFLLGFYKALAFGAGPCMLCKECNSEKCLHPNDARPAMEACGIDVYATARSNGFPIEVLKDHACDPNFYGIVLID